MTGKVSSTGGDEDVDDEKTTRPSNWIGLKYLVSAWIKESKKTFRQIR